MGSSIPANSCRTNNRCNAPSTGSGCTITVPGTCVYYSGTRLSGPDINVGDTFNAVINKLNNYISTGGGTVTSVALSMPAAFSVAGSPITDTGTFTVTGAGTSSQYVAGDGSLITFPDIPDQFNPIQGAGITLTGTYPNITFSSTSSGITALTGDVTASGSGSVVATLSNTGVTSGSYLSANVTVDTKGRITAISDGPLAAINPARMGQIGKSKFIVLASAIVRLQRGAMIGGGTYDIDYTLLDTTSAHDYHFFTSAEADIVGQIQVNFPLVKYVHYGIMVPDDSFASAGIFFGTGVDLDKMHSNIWLNGQETYLVKLSDVTSTPTAISNRSLLTISVDGGGKFTIADPNYNTSGGSTTMVYAVASMLLKLRIAGSFAYIRYENDATTGLPDLQFTIRDGSNNVITVFDSSNTGDFIQITEPITAKAVIDARYWREFQMNKVFLNVGSITNIWCFGIFEVYLMCSPVSSSIILAEWQPFPNATDYQLYRSLNAAFTGEIQVYTGVGFSFSDTGLSADTPYWYRLKGTVSGVPNTIMTSFDTKTSPV